MIFVPLTFVTSVYGMDNMDENPQYWEFAIVLVTVCIPFFLLIGFLNTDSGYRIWMEKTKALWAWIKPKKEAEAEEEMDVASAPMARTYSMEEGMKTRLGESERGSRPQSHPPQSYSHIKRIVEAVGDGKQSGLSRIGTIMADSAEGSKGGSEAADKKEAVAASKDTVINIDSGSNK